MLDRPRLPRQNYYDFRKILGSGLAVNLSTFAVLALAPLMLTTPDFADLTLAVAGSMFGAVLLDVGLGTTSVRQFAATRDPRFLSASLRFRLLLVIAVLPLAAGSLFIPDGLPFGVAALGAAALNIWSGLRCADQAREDHSAFSRANFMLAAARLVCGGLALVTGSWLLTALALFAVPVALVSLARLYEIIAYIRVAPDDALRTMRAYSASVFVSALSYNACIYLPQAIAAARLGDEAVGSLGIASTLVAPLVLVNGALRVMLLPRVAAGADISSGAGSSITPVFIVFGAVLLTAAAGIGADLVYGRKFAEVGWVVGVSVLAYLAVVPLGLLNMAVHRIGRPELEAIVNVGRLVVTAPVLWLSASSTVHLALAAGIMLVVGEVLLFSLVRRASPSVR